MVKLIAFLVYVFMFVGCSMGQSSIVSRLQTSLNSTLPVLPPPPVVAPSASSTVLIGEWQSVNCYGNVRIVYAVDPSLLYAKVTSINYVGGGCTGGTSYDSGNINGMDNPLLLKSISYLPAYSGSSDPRGLNGSYFFAELIKQSEDDNSVVLVYINNTEDVMYVGDYTSVKIGTYTSATISALPAATNFLADPSSFATIVLNKAPAVGVTFPFTPVAPAVFDGTINSAYGEFQSECVLGGPSGNPYGRYHLIMNAVTYSQSFVGYSDKLCETPTGVSNVLMPAGTPWFVIDYPTVTGFEGKFSSFNINNVFAYGTWLNTTGTVYCGSTSNILGSLAGATPPTGDPNWDNFVLNPFPTNNVSGKFCLSRVGN